MTVSVHLEDDYALELVSSLHDARWDDSYATDDIVGQAQLMDAIENQLPWERVMTHFYGPLEAIT